MPVRAVHIHPNLVLYVRDICVLVSGVVTLRLADPYGPKSTSSGPDGPILVSRMLKSDPGHLLAVQHPLLTVVSKLGPSLVIGVPHPLVLERQHASGILSLANAENLDMSPAALPSMSEAQR